MATKTRALFLCLCLTVYIMTSLADLVPAFDVDVGPQNICGDGVPPHQNGGLSESGDVTLSPSLRSHAHRLGRKVIQLRRSLFALLGLYESDRLSRSVDIDRVQYFPPCFDVINRSRHAQLTDLSPLTIYHSLWQDFRTMTDLLGRLELMKQDEETFHTSEFNHHYRRISIFAKSLLCELSFSISGMDSSTPTTFVEPRLEKWCVAEAADDCARCDRDSMVLSMLSKLMSVLGQKYRHIKQSL